MHTAVPEVTNRTSAPPRVADGSAVLPPVPRHSMFPPSSPTGSHGSEEDHEATDSGYSSGPEYQKAPDYVCHSSRTAPDPDYRGRRESIYTNSDYREVSDSKDRPAQGRRKRREKREVPDFDYRPAQGHLEHLEHWEVPNSGYRRPVRGQRKRQVHRELIYSNADYGSHRECRESIYTNADYREVSDSDYRPAQGHRKRQERRKRGKSIHTNANYREVSDSALSPTSNSIPAHPPTTRSVPALLPTSKCVPAPCPPSPSYVSVADEYDLKVGAPKHIQVASQDTASQSIASLGVMPRDVFTMEAPPFCHCPISSTWLSTQSNTGPQCLAPPPHRSLPPPSSPTTVPRPPLVGSPYHHRPPMGRVEPSTLTGAARDRRSPTPPGRSTACSILLSINSSSRVHGAKNYRISIFRGHRNGETTSDKDLFLQLRRAYNAELRSFWQRFFSLRGLQYISVIDYTHPEAPVLLPSDEASRDIMLYAFNKPHKLATGGAWVDWVFSLKERPPRRYGLEFVQGWDRRKIVMLAVVPWVCSVVTAVLWGALRVMCRVPWRWRAI